MARLGELTAAQTPVLRNLQGASGDLDTLPHPPASVRRDRRPGAGGARQGVRAGPARRQGLGRRDRRAARAGPRRARLRQAAAPAAADQRRPRPRCRGRPARRADRPAGRRQDPHRTRQERRLHRLRGDLELLLLAGADDQQHGRHRQGAAAGGRRQRVQPVHGQAQPRAAGSLQPVPRADPAGRDHARPNPHGSGRGTGRRRSGPPPVRRASTRTAGPPARLAGRPARRQPAGRRRARTDGPRPRAPLPNLPVPSVPTPPVPVPTTPAPAPPGGGGGQGGLPLLDWLLGGG